MASDDELAIANGLKTLLSETNPNSFTSLNDVVLRLQSKLGFDLSTRIDFIRDQITLFFTPTPPPPPPQPPQQHHLNPNPNPNPISDHNRQQHQHQHQHKQQQQQLQLAASTPPAAAVVTRPVPAPVNTGQGQGQGHNVSAAARKASVAVYNPGNVPRHPHSQVNVSRHPHSHVHQVQQQQHVFPKGPTEISFAQPGGGILVASDAISSPTAKDGGQKQKRRGGSGGLNKLCGVTPELQAIVGQPALPRTEIVKQLWAYIRKNNLQDPSNKRKIICNEELRLVFEVDCTDMFQMNKLLAKHILPLASPKDSGQQSKKLKVEESQVPSSEPAPPIVISEALAKFFGTSEKEMLLSDVYKRIEEYIKTEGLEDPLNSMVACDPKLQELLGCESITASAIRDALARNHLFQQA